MKAWVVFIKDELFSELCHAETAGKAKRFGLALFNLERGDYTIMRARRVKELDDVPITYQTCKDANWEWTDEGGAPLPPEEFMCWCQCPLCKPNLIAQILRESLT